MQNEPHLYNMSSPQPAGETINLNNDVKVAQFPYLVTLSNTSLTLQNFHLQVFRKIISSLIRPAKQADRLNFACGETDVAFSWEN